MDSLGEGLRGGIYILFLLNSFASEGIDKRLEQEYSQAPENS
jgi:hypothetical protein